MLPHGARIPGGTVPFRYGEAKGIFSFEKRMSPQPPKEKRGGISISPRTPLKRHKGAKLRFLPFGNPSKDKGSGSGERSRGCPLCDPTNAMPANAGTHSGHLGTFSAAGRRLLIFVGSSYRPLLRMGELTQMCQLILQSIFLLYRVRHVFFLARQKGNVGDILHGKVVPSRAA